MLRKSLDLNAISHIKNIKQEDMEKVKVQFVISSFGKKKEETTIRFTFYIFFYIVILNYFDGKCLIKNICSSTKKNRKKILLK